VGQFETLSSKQITHTPQQLFNAEWIRKEMPLPIKARDMAKKVAAVVRFQQGPVGTFGSLDVFGQMDSGFASPFHYGRANDEIKYCLRVG
jgi:hypothetical protein